MKEIFVDKHFSGIRIDKFLASYFAKATKDGREFFSPGISRGEIIQMIKSGGIMVNDRKVKPSYILKAGDKIVFPSPPPSPDGRGGLVLNPGLNIKIVYQDKNIIVVDKPVGISVHPTKPDEKNTLVNFLIYKFPEIQKVVDSSSYIRGIDDVYTTDPKLRPGIVHRLDKETSGVMVIARNTKALLELKKLFQERKVEKKYLALVYGVLKKKSGVIEKPIARAGTYKKQVIAGRKTKTKIREAITKFRVIKDFRDYSLLEVIPKTGRMHQIRVHLFSIGHPIVGDKLYKLKLFPRSHLRIDRHMLHAKSISFKLFGKNYSFSAPPPADFQKAQKSLNE